MTARKHIATYPLFGSFPISGGYDQRNRIGTGYIYTAGDYAETEERLRDRNHPFRPRWRNDECFAEYCRQLDEQTAALALAGAQQ